MPPVLVDKCTFRAELIINLVSHSHRHTVLLLVGGFLFICRDRSLGLSLPPKYTQFMSLIADNCISSAAAAMGVIVMYPFVIIPPPPPETREMRRMMIYGELSRDGVEHSDCTD